MEAWREQHEHDPPVDCEFCGKPFVKQDVRQKYCSNECKEKRDDVARRKQPEYGDCAHCGNRFLKSRADRLYCSQKCIQSADRLRRGKEPVGKFQHKCAECKRLFYTSHPQQKYCSILCAKQPRLREHKEYNHRNRTHDCPTCGKHTTKLYCSDKCRKEREQQLLAQPAPDVEYRTCTICGTTFIPYAKNQLTCSKDCATEKNRRYAETKRGPRVIRHCKRCGKELVPYGKKYCSADCKWEHYRELAKVADSPPLKPKPAIGLDEFIPERRTSDRSYSPERMRRIIDKYGVKNPLAGQQKEESQRAIEAVKNETKKPYVKPPTIRHSKEPEWSDDNL